MLKRAWICDTEKIVSFHHIVASKLYEEDEKVFWLYIKTLILDGYRIQ